MTKTENDLHLYTQYAQNALYGHPEWTKTTDEIAVTAVMLKLDDDYLTSDLAFTDGKSEVKDSWGNPYNCVFVNGSKSDAGADAAKVDALTDCAFIFYSYGADAVPSTTGYTYDNVIDSAGNGSLKLTDGKLSTSFGDDIVTVVYMNASGEVSVASYNAGK